MSHSNHASTFQSQTPPRPGETPEMREFLEELAIEVKFSIDRVRSVLASQYGSVEKGIIAVKNTRAESERARNIPVIAQIGRKPREGEAIQVTELGPNVSIRVFEGDLAQYHSYSLDFVDKSGQYIRTPKDITLYSDHFGGAQIFSIEESLRRQRKGSAGFNRSMERLHKGKAAPDPNWETYKVPEGIRIRIKQEGHDDRFLDIPTRGSAVLCPELMLFQG
ncbi:hypothetical protein D9615_008420 [Tricholomella constricta]|uniref:Uncharacterized protein n=1 Tax=Tricholomella constricta TaxID=117010 RepID=A0A8H5M4Z1_9AGAR|nr:hypothetical protein D9615_008420 [Tricholomella constricta]